MTENPTQETPTTPRVTEEDLKIINMTKEQIGAILKASECILVPVTTIVNGKIFQLVEVLRQPKKSVLTSIKGGKIVSP